MMAACRYTRLKVHGKVHKYYGTSPIVFGSDGVDTVCNKGAVHKKASLRNEGQGERNKCQDQGQCANFLCTCTKKQAGVTNGIMLLSFLTRE